MAATLTGAGELTYASFPIDKVETDADGDLIVYGKASDGSIDSDQQIVDPSWMAQAARAWKESGANLRVQHNAQRDPAGVGLEVETDSSGATWVKGLVVEPIAKRLVAKGALRAYSVGIARPTITRDATARGGRITDGELVEISLVDRPANKRCGIQLVKSVDGTPEYVGEMFGAEADIAKALDADVAKAAPADDDFVNVDLPKDASISISPADFAKLHTFKQQLTTKTATADTEKRDITAGEPGVANPLDDSDSTSKGTVTETETEAPLEKAEAPAEDAAAPDVTKDPAVKPAKKAKKPKKMPPWLNKPSGDDGDEKDPDDGACKSVTDHLWTGIEGTSDIECAKCHTTPAQAAGVTASPMTAAPVGELQESDAPMSVKSSPTPASASSADGEHMDPVPAHREPDGAIVEPFEDDAELPKEGQGETPTKLEAPMMKASDLAPDPEVAALLRFKSIGADEDMGRLHDLTCPAYHPDDVARYHPFADIGGLIDSRAWQRKALAAAAGPIEAALKGHEVWEAALLLKTADGGDLNDWRLEAHKAFRDANPGPGAYPTPGSVGPQRYSRPVLAGGRAANAVDYAGPTTAPQVADGAPNAASFDRPPLAAAHQSPSPSHMKGDGEYPAERGAPMQLSYAQAQKDHQRQALTRMHDHLSRQTPDMCPLGAEGVMQPENHPVPAIAGIGKSDGGVTPVPAEGVKATLEQGEAVVPAAALKSAAAAEMFADDTVYKGFKKMRKKLGKKVLAGQMTVDEARARMGRQFAQKSAEDSVEAAQKGAADGVSCTIPGAQVTYGGGGNGSLTTVEVIKNAVAPLTAVLDPEVIKSAVAEATSDLKDLLVKQQETFTEKLAEQQRVIDAIADQPDPSTAAYAGGAFTPVQKSRQPAAVPDQAEYAARAQNMIRRNLQTTYSNHSNPFVREKAAEALAQLGVEVAPNA